MTAKEFNQMVKEANKRGANIHCRVEFEELAYYLSYSLKAIGREDLAEELGRLYDEMEGIDSGELTRVTHEANPYKARR